MHLDARSYAALIAGTLPPGEARALADHLAGECERCERFLAEQDAVDRLDGAADAAIAEALPAGEGAGNDVEFARILRAVGARRAAPRWVIPAAVAAALLVTAVGLLSPRLARRDDLRSGWQEKGGAVRGIPTRLRFLELQEGGRIVKGIPGERVSASSSLLFEVETGRAADVALLRVAPDGGAELIWRARTAAGSTQVMVDGHPAAYPLSGTSGVQRFVLVASESRLPDSSALAAGAALAPPSAPSAEAPALDGLSLDVVDVSVDR